MLDRDGGTRSGDRRGSCFGPCGGRICGVCIISDVRVADGVVEALLQ